MRLRVGAALAALVAGAGLLVTPGVALAAQRVCRIGAKHMTELSGMAATPGGLVVVNDGSDDPAARKIFYLDGRCAVTRTVSYPSRPRDTEDLGIAPDGTLWVADIGDNNRNRPTIGLWRLPKGAGRPKLYRLTYPDGPHDAEALLFDGDGTPIVVTKTIGTAGIYEPAKQLDAAGTTPLRKVGEVTPPITTTSNPFSIPGRLVITGGAVSPDGRHAVLRTYADAFEFDVAGGDVAGALTHGEPRQIPMPDEPQGESVTYTTDGTALLTVSETSRQPPGTEAEILRYALPPRPAVTTSPAAAPTNPSVAHEAKSVAGAAARKAGTPAGMLVTGGALLLGLATLLGVLVLRRSRRS
ncbi:hypothetical protein [Actinoplanes subtropicus]|uniref:hypothetical protein n=1 Tax=Actinoplanes subtropicus TaxID=543632 RepID=UPI0004C335D1|nr:hypothetical protein [Actinoplanes subtropicus]